LTFSKRLVTIDPMNIPSKQEIIKYLLFEKESRFQRERYDGIIKPKTPNLSEAASEALVAHLIKDGDILKELQPIVTIELLGKNGKDILVNKFHKIEVKGTSCVEGCVTTSESNFESFAWVWPDFRPFFHASNSIINIHVIRNPKVSIRSKRYVEKLNEYKLSLKNAVNDAIKARNYEYLRFNLKTMLTLEDLSKRWFVNA